MNLFRKKTSVQLSTEMERVVRGYKVKRLPLGDYLRAMEAAKKMPERVVEACFPQMEPDTVLRALKKIDKAMLNVLIMRLMEVVPAEAIALLSLLTGVPEEALMSDPGIGLDGAAEMVEAFMELNGIENFMHAAERIAAKVKQMKHGFKS